jgi:hypothetical protein
MIWGLALDSPFILPFVRLAGHGLFMLGMINSVIPAMRWIDDRDCHEIGPSAISIQEQN